MTCPGTSGRTFGIGGGGGDGGGGGGAAAERRRQGGGSGGGMAAAKVAAAAAATVAAAVEEAETRVPQEPVVVRFRCRRHAAAKQGIFKRSGGNNPAKRKRACSRGGAVDGIDHKYAVGDRKGSRPAHVGHQNAGRAGTSSVGDDQLIGRRVVGVEERVQQQLPALSEIVAGDSQAVGGRNRAAGQVDRASIVYLHKLASSERHDFMGAGAGEHRARQIDRQRARAGTGIAQRQGAGECQFRAVGEFEQLPIDIAPDHAGGGVVPEQMVG